MSDIDRDALIRMTAFEHVRRLGEVHGHLTADELNPGFVFEGERIPLVNPQRGIFKPRQMRYLLSIKTVFPRPGARVWYDDQRDVHRQIFEGDEMVDYAFMGRNPEAADNRWLREAFENGVPVVYFLGIAPGRYQALPVFISGWDANALKARVAFGVPEQDVLLPPENALERRYALRAVKQRLHQASFRNYRNDARKHLERFEEEFGSGDNDRLKYAALELRMVMEALTYDRALAYKDEFPPNEYETWQPRKLMAVLLDINPVADQDSSIRFGVEEEYNGTSPAMRSLGSEKLLNMATLKEHYDAPDSVITLRELQEIS